jgi:heme/copper-type cytochrome/quinol oxidase subunit 4
MIPDWPLISDGRWHSVGFWIELLPIFDSWHPNLWMSTSRYLSFVSVSVSIAMSMFMLMQHEREQTWKSDFFLYRISDCSLIGLVWILSISWCMKSNNRPFAQQNFPDLGIKRRILVVRFSRHICRCQGATRVMTKTHHYLLVHQAPISVT